MLCLFCYLIAHHHWPNALHIWSNAQINQMCLTITLLHCKAYQILGLTCRTFTHLDCQLMKQLFVALVRSHLEYRNVVWHPCLKKDMQLLEGVQHRATRMVPGLSKLNYERRLKLMDCCPSCLVEDCEVTSLKYTST